MKKVFEQKISFKRDFNLLPCAVFNLLSFNSLEIKYKKNKRVLKETRFSNGSCVERF